MRPVSLHERLRGRPVSQERRPNLLSIEHRSGNDLENRCLYGREHGDFAFGYMKFSTLNFSRIVKFFMRISLATNRDIY